MDGSSLLPPEPPFNICMHLEPGREQDQAELSWAGPLAGVREGGGEREEGPPHPLLGRPGGMRVGGESALLPTSCMSGMSRIGRGRKMESDSDRWKRREGKRKKEERLLRTFR